MQKSTSLKGYMDNYIQEAKEKKVSMLDLSDSIRAEFGCSATWVQRVFKSYYGMTITEKTDEILDPTRDALVQAILTTETVAELWGCLGLNERRRAGVFDKNFGVSTYAKAKAVCLNETFETSYQPSICENKSLLASQILGDGSYNKVRGAVIISHGEEQAGYLLYKASLFNKAFPTTKPAGNMSMNTHTQGHKYACWYSGRLPSKLTTWAEETALKDVVKALSPFGLLLWFLDDGYFNLDFTTRGNNYFQMYVHDQGALDSLVEELGLYGVECTVSKNVLKVGTMSSAVVLYKCFIEPFSDNIPECMRYKTEMKI